jgi:hypothetical protein
MLDPLPAGLYQAAEVCRALALPRHWPYPDPRRRPRPKVARPNSRRFSAAEDEKLIAHLHSERFQDAAQPQIHATLLSEGEGAASVSTMYRRLARESESRERRNRGRPPRAHFIDTSNHIALLG